jgi:hypothetical protein
MRPTCFPEQEKPISSLNSRNQEPPMPKNKVSDPITDQEMAFARLVLSGTMTDRQAAEAAGLNPDSAAYTKSKPYVRAYMHEHRAAVEQQLVQEEAEGLRRLSLDREQVLARLWEIANLSPDMTRGSITGQVKALSMIVAMLNFIPDRLATSSEKNSAPAPNRGSTASNFVLPSRADLSRPAVEGPAAPLNPPPGSPAPPVPPSRGARREAGGAPPNPGPGQSTFANRFTPLEAPPSPYVTLFGSVPDLRVGFPVKNPFVHPR